MLGWGWGGYDKDTARTKDTVLGELNASQMMYKQAWGGVVVARWPTLLLLLSGALKLCQLQVRVTQENHWRVAWQNIDRLLGLAAGKAVEQSRQASYCQWHAAYKLMQNRLPSAEGDTLHLFRRRLRLPCFPFHFFTFSLPALKYLLS